MFSLIRLSVRVRGYDDWLCRNNSISNDKVRPTGGQPNSIDKMYDNGSMIEATCTVPS
jgi:hypothetical protein